MSDRFDVRKSDRPFDQSHTLVAVIELSQASWLVGGMVPGLERSPLKKLSPDQDEPHRVCRRLFGLSHATIANSSICA
jgi:transposase